MWFQNPIFTIDNVKSPGGRFVVQREHKNLVGVSQIPGRAG